MRIDGITKTKGNKIKVFFDTQTSLTFNKDVWLESGLEAGTEIEENVINSLLLRSECLEAEQKALNCLTRRGYGVKELSRKLSMQFSQQAVEAAVEKMCGFGYLDDEKYARSLAQRLLETKHMAPRQISYALFEKGLDRELVREVTAELEPDLRAQIRCVFEKKYARALETEQGRRRAVSAAMRLGYGYDDIRAVLSEMTEASE